MSRGAEWTVRLALVSVSVLMTFAVLELGCRLSEGRHWLLHWPNLVAQELAVRAHGSGYVHDPVLGFVPQPKFASPSFSVDDRGNRAMPPLARGASGALLLVTGASFAFGEEVHDDSSWPVYLQALVGRRTVNAGVSAYGLDQTVLRTEQEAAFLKPTLIVLSFDSESLLRSESRRTFGALKPYFTIDDKGALALQNVPVPNVMDGGVSHVGLTFWQRAFGWSLLIDMTMQRLGQWDGWMGLSERVTPDGTAERLACPLMQRLAKLNTPTLIVAQYAHGYWKLDERSATGAQHLSRIVLECAAQAGLSTFDTFDVVDRAVRERGLNNLYLRDHHNPEGNRLIGESIAAELKRQGLLK